MNDVGSMRLQERFASRPHSPAAALLSPRLLAIDGERGFARLQFDGKPDFCNPMGMLQGGFQTAMLDEAMAIAAIATVDFGRFVPTLELKVSFVRPAMPGVLIGEGQVVRSGRNVVFTEGRLLSADETLLATASATAVWRQRDDGAA